MVDRNNGMQQQLINLIQASAWTSASVAVKKGVRQECPPVADNLPPCDWLSDEDNHGSTKGNAVDPHPEAERFTL